MNFISIAKPLIAITEKQAKVKFTQKAFHAFNQLKSALMEAPILSFPDFTKPFIVETDTSMVGLGAVLTQKLRGRERPAAYGSRVLSKTERNYSATD